MRTIARWLNVELLRIHRLRLRVFHGIGLLILGAILVLVFAVGIFVGYHYPYRTLPPPPVPKGQTTPDCGSSNTVTRSNDHSLGQCLPQPKPKRSATARFTLAAFTTGITGPDVSNNDPLSCAQVASVAAHYRLLYLKSVESSAFFDGTAAGMASCAKPRHLPVGGYDFLHVCLVSPTSEAAWFVHALSVQGLLGSGTLPPAGDAEYPFGSLGCSGRVWIQTWVDYVYNHDGGICPIMYSGAWWWQPHIGGWWPTCRNVRLVDWVSGYGVRAPFMPGLLTLAALDLWQYTDHGPYGDHSAWQHSPAQFVSFARSTPPVPPNPYRIYDKTRRHLGRGVVASERNTVATWDRAKCRTPARRPACKSTYLHLQLERDRVYFLAHHHLVRGRWVALSRPRWGAPSKQQPFGARYAGISRRLR